MSDVRMRSAQESGDRMGIHLNAMLEALERVRAETIPAAVLDLAPIELCATGIFDRVLWSRVRGSTWLPQALYGFDGVDGAIREIDGGPSGPVEDLDIPLASPLVEAEVVRRRLPALVQDAQHEPRTFRQLVERTGTSEYVVAPVVASSAVIGLLHADTTKSARTLTAVDRDLLRLFADGVGLMYERAGLVERADLQRRQVAEVCEAAMRSLQDIGGGPAPEIGVTVRTTAGLREPGGRSHARLDEPRDAGRLSRLTVREREVLALLASGATNAQLADRLTVAESTVKSHVKHILHKLGAGNRAAAIAFYLRETRVHERRP
ncbi:LuxR C-terminal-related transcriptional regulator [Mycolicibacterium sp.]|uniref:LuxR C-terminal-related transcriptional regulator n=1 Tax=Mycolicibacterium sp. TaxID=2320850 RepID=UPI001A2674AF|nr:LuxR C-terminal-related transcriptional regulator [Mycolicibacterium sp.]MBJ7337573.1 GAF domain-containing protein [Mycolicibacterium sp.]